MPFTSYHIAFGLFVGLPSRRWIHLPTFLITTAVIVDIEPIMVMLGAIGGMVHGSLHTILLGVFMGFTAGLAMYFLERYFGFLKTLYRSFYLSQGSEKPLNYILAGVLGWILHIVLDALIYSDIRPLEPFISSYNPLYLSHAISLPVISLAYNVILVAGLSLYIFYFFRISLAENGFKPTLFKAGVLIVLASLTIAPVEINFMDVAPATIILGLSGIALSASSLYLLILLSTGRLIIVLSILSIIALLSLNKSLSSLEIFVTLYIGIAVILALLRRSLSRIEITIYRASVKVIDLVIISWIATIVLVGIPMLIATLVLLLIRSNLLTPRDLKESMVGR
jgi:hypothetical protein